MQKTTTLTRLRLFFGKMLPLLIIMAVSVMKISAQPYVNGVLSTGTTTVSGVTSPAGYTWSECQNPTGNTTVANTTAGVGAQISANNSVADDFTVPGGVGWALTKVTVYGYSTGYTGTASPYTAVRVRIHRGNPLLGPTTIVYGDLTTNRFAASSDSKMYRIFNTVVAPISAPDAARIIWKIEANVSVTLGPGVYWLEYQIGTSQASNFAPLSTPTGVRTLPGYNAIQSLAGVWAALADPGQGPAATPVAVDMPFTIDYSVVAAPPCTPITSAAISAPNVLFSQNFNTAIPLPAGWAQQNLSSPLGPNGWLQGNAANFPANSGATNSYITALWSSTSTTGPGTISNWLFTPNVTLNNGDQFSFFTRTASPAATNFPDRLQVRMSTNGASTNVGASATSTGDFGTLLLDIDPNYIYTDYPNVWTKFTVTVSGVPASGISGRIAFRYFVENGGGGTAPNSNVIGIDDVAYTAVSAPTICSGGTSNLVVNITGGVAPYNLVLNAAPGGNFPVTNYTSGNNIPVTPTANTVYTIVSVTSIDGCTSPSNTGSATINATTGSTAAVLSQVTSPPVPSVTFNEGFDGTIAPAGWSMQNLSNPVGTVPNWRQGAGLVAGLAPNSGAGFASVDFNSTTGTNTISNWLFSPQITNMKAGDKFTFYTRARTGGGTFPDRLQVRMNTTGSTNAGATNTSVGDFTTLLLDINPTYTTTGYPEVWTQFTITIPANAALGRLAFRYFVENGGPSGDNSFFIGVDDAVYTTTVPGPAPTTCTGSTANLKVDITGGTSPYEVTITPTAPAGAPIVITGYISGAPIPVTPAVTTTYALTQVKSAIGCIGTGNSGTPTITVSPTTTTPLVIQDNPTGPLCAGDPKLLTVIGGSTFTTFTAAPAANAVPGAGTGAPAGAPAAVYPVNNVVSGLPTSGVVVKSVTLKGLSHTWMSDLDIVLQSPTGQNVILMSDAGRDGNLANHTLTFDDAAAAPLNNTAGGTNPPATGTTWKPTNLIDYLAIGDNPDNWPATGPLNTPTSTTLSTFTGNFNGTWKLFMTDDGSSDVGDLAGGYDIVFAVPPGPLAAGYTFVWSPATGLSSTTGNPVAASPMTTTTYQVMGTAPSGCQTTAQITITVNQLPAVTAQPTATTVCSGSSATFTAAGSGAGASYQWQVSTTGVGGPYTNITNAAPYSGVNSGTLTINPVTNAMNGWFYRLVVSGTCPPAANSVGAVLNVTPLPTITITPATACGGNAGINGTLLTASGANTYVWAPLTGLYTNATATTPYTGGNSATVYAAPTVNTVYTVSGTNTTTGCVGTATATITYTPVAPTISPVAVSICSSPRTVTPLTITSALAPSSTSVSSGTISVPVSDFTDVATNTTLNVAGIPVGATISQAVVTLNMKHTYPGDMIFNLKAPGGKILNLYKYNGGLATGAVGNLAAAGWYNAKITNTSTTAFSAVPTPFAYGTTAPTGPFKPDALNTDVTGAGFPFNNPAGSISDANSFADLYSPANPPNGTWTLTMADGGPGDLGTLTSWSLDFTYGVPSNGIWSPATGLYLDAAGTIPYDGSAQQTVYASPTATTTYSVTVQNGSCVSPAKTVTVTVNSLPVITVEPVNAEVCTDKVTSFQVTATGAGLSYQWQESTNQGNTFTNIANGGVYSGATTRTLTITHPPFSMNTNQYRVIVSSAAPCVPDTSLRRVLTVHELPIVDIFAVQLNNLMPGNRTVIRSQVTPNGVNYEWFRNGSLVATTTAPEDSLLVDVDALGTYTLRVTDIYGCVNTSNELLIGDQASSAVFIYPNPSSGTFQVRFHSSLNNTGVPRGLNVYDDKGAKVYSQRYNINAPYGRMDVDMRRNGSGTYWVEVVDVSGNRLAVGRVIVLR